MGGRHFRDDRRTVLPEVRLDGGTFVVDLRLRQFRQTMNPGGYVDFESVKG